MAELTESPRFKGNPNTNALKLIALFFMICDHFGKMLLPNVPEMRVLGRIAFPLYCFCIVAGACYTHSFPRYALRILLVGLISQPLYMLALNHTWSEPNIFLTLLLGILALWGIREKKFASHIWAPALALVSANVLRCDYGWRGVLLIILLYGAKDSKAAIAAVMTAFCLFWGTNSGAVDAFFGLRFDFLKWEGVGSILAAFFRLQGLAILALPFMLIPMRFEIRLSKWLGYALYPAHLAVLIILRYILR